MAAEYRKFYYDWNDGKYKLNQENFIFANKMERKPGFHFLDGTKARDFMNLQGRRLPGQKNVNEDEVFVKDAENKLDNNKVADSVDLGRPKANQKKVIQSLEELSKGHKVMTSVLNTRLLRLNAAKTLWHKDMNSFIEYVLRLEDDAVLVDLLPILTKRVKNDGPESPSLSMGACLDLLPALGKLVESKFEDYIVASMDMIREVMKRWWKELQATGKKEKEEFNKDFRCSRSVGGVYMLIISMTDRIKVLSKRNGRVGDKAKVLQELMALI